MMNKLKQLQENTIIVADTGDIEAISKYAPQDATTNPSLILKAVQSGQFDSHIEKLAKSNLSFEALMDQIATTVGVEILQLVPGYVSTEVDARLSFDKAATIEKAQALIALYEDAGYSRDRILIKMASTWEGIQAAAELEKEGIHCNLTLLFGMAQARACADANVTLISPFVGRILDWYKKSTGEDYTAETDPGVLSVQEIFTFYKKHGYKTIVMGASFRNIGEIEQLNGCDRLTISPGLLEELSQDTGPLKTLLKYDDAVQPAPAAITEAQFRIELNQDAMATEKLAEGIRNFIKDTETLEALVKSKFLS
ncbi:transaldolase [Reinekea forsetii]|nr:transaldolase [Reinekea forsetii]